MGLREVLRNEGDKAVIFVFSSSFEMLYNVDHKHQTETRPLEIRYLYCWSIGPAFLFQVGLESGRDGLHSACGKTFAAEICGNKELIVEP